MTYIISLPFVLLNLENGKEEEKLQKNLISREQKEHFR